MQLQKSIILLSLWEIAVGVYTDLRIMLLLVKSEPQRSEFWHCLQILQAVTQPLASEYSRVLYSKRLMINSCCNKDSYMFFWKTRGVM